MGIARLCVDTDSLCPGAQIAGSHIKILRERKRLVTELLNHILVKLAVQSYFADSTAAAIDSAAAALALALSSFLRL